MQPRDGFIYSDDRWSGAKVEAILAIGIEVLYNTGRMLVKKGWWANILVFGCLPV